ncbi:hypothetical protein LJ737_02595 [Hymenobacter sp. 15J16-1T3B]|uniref:hypothetical protein n=1 Tax=Hymenobacter sp. 15J16-1T3B TaxID=2886941 RepID=UPI001D12CB2A|nr:hypothetical protein [Hymenobacter sp. 15J16-1T3B]MCC3156105.1 hypothetical protein [Hymenobacter sp. 15J16-1T3B]
MLARRFPPSWFASRALRRLGPALGVTALLSGPAPAQHIPVRPDSVVVPSSAAAAVPDTVRRPAAPPEPPPDAEPTPGPVSGRARWTILGACALLTLSTLLLYNVRSR